MGKLRVMTFNLFALALDQEAAAEVIRSAAPDVVALQEPPLWTWGHRRMRRMASDLNYELVVCRGKARTTGIMVRRDRLPEVSGYGGVALAPRISRLRLGWPTPRGYSWIGIGPVKIFNVHLSLLAGERARHVARVRAAVDAHGHEFSVLVGDINEVPSGPAWAEFSPPLLDAGAQLDHPTYSAQSPERRIDAIFTGTKITAAPAEHVLTEAAARASDHLAVVCDISWPDLP